MTFKKSPAVESAAEKARYIHRHRQKLGGISKGCRGMKMARSTYYHQLKKTSGFQEEKDLALREKSSRYIWIFPATDIGNFISTLKGLGKSSTRSGYVGWCGNMVFFLCYGGKSSRFRLLSLTTTYQCSQTI